MKSQKPSIVEAAWAAYFKASEADDLDALRNEGWKTVGDIAEMSPVGTSKNAVRKKAEEDRKLEKKSIRALHKGRIRTFNVYRPHTCEQVPAILSKKKLSTCKSR